MSRVALVLLASLFAGCASAGSREVVTLPALFVCDRDVYWFEHPPIKTFKAPRFSPPKNLLYSPLPDYTYEARLKLWEDTMLVELHVTPKGTVDHVKIVEHPRHPLFELVAKEGFRQWRFTPGTADRVRIPVTFSLHCREKRPRHLTKRWSERRTAVRSTFEMTPALPLRSTRALVRRRSSCSR